MSHILIIPKISIHNANALSSPYTIGFPAMTAWMGAVHALQRAAQQSGVEDAEDIQFSAMSIISNDFTLHTHQGTGDYIQSIIGKGVPLKKDGTKASFIEEARCDLTVSIIIECTGVSSFFAFDELLVFIDNHITAKMKFAGGDVLKADPSQYAEVYNDDDAGLQKVVRTVMPGYALIERKDLMQTYMQETENAIDGLLKALTLHRKCTQDDNQKVTWAEKATRAQEGWIVPIAVGFQGITDLNNHTPAINQRDQATPHRFAESIVTLGEFKMPHHFDLLDDILWTTHYDETKNLYLCQQKDTHF